MATLETGATCDCLCENSGSVMSQTPPENILHIEDATSELIHELIIMQTDKRCLLLVGTLDDLPNAARLIFQDLHSLFRSKVVNLGVLDTQQMLQRLADTIEGSLKRCVFPQGFSWAQNPLTLMPKLQACARYDVQRHE